MLFQSSRVKSVGMDARETATPEVLPWLPPGKPQDESFNKFAHKKGSIASRINAEVRLGWVGNQLKKL